MRLIGCQATGGLGGKALLLDSGNYIVAGDSRSLYRASGRSMPAIEVTRTARLTIDPNVTLIPSGNAPPISGGGTVIKRRIPALQATGAAPGNTVMTELYSPAGHAVVLMIGVHKGPLSIPPFGDLWIDPLTLLIIAAGVQNQTEHWKVYVASP